MGGLGYSLRETIRLRVKCRLGQSSRVSGDYRLLLKESPIRI